MKTNPPALASLIPQADAVPQLIAATALALLASAADCSRSCVTQSWCSTR